MILGIDVGTTAVKVVLVSEDGEVLVKSSEPHALLTPRPGWAEEEPAAWWKGVLKATRDVLQTRDGVDVRAIGVSGMVPAVVLLDRHGHVLRPSIQQNDARSAAEIAVLRQSFAEGWLFDATGADWSQQSVAPKLLWIQRNEPAVWRQVSRITGAYEYVTWLLSEVPYCEANWALESGLWGVAEEQWLEPVLDIVGVTPSMLSTVRRAHEIVGSISTTAARALGLRAGTPVIAGSADHVASILAAGASRPGQVIVKLGGAGDFLYTIDSFAPLRELFIDFHDIPGLYVLNGCMATSGSLVRWYADGLRPGVTLASLDQEAESVPAGSNGLILLPYFLGEKTPIHDPAARGTIIGLSLAHGPQHIYRAVLEGIAYAFRHHFDILQAAGHRVSEVYAMDGGAQSPVWRGILASVLQKPIQYVKDGSIGSALGVSYLAGTVVNAWDWGDLQSLSLREPSIALPNPGDLAVYDRGYAIYRETYCRLRDLYPRLQEEVQAVPSRTSDDRGEWLVSR